MYQSFTGSSRRPRQVNLSGRNANPFAAAGNGLGGPQGTIQSAHLDRQQRQKQRQELNAAKTVQRVWRGHRTRRETLDTWRQLWDAADPSVSDPVQRLNTLLLFFSPSNQADVQRLISFVSHRPLEPATLHHYLRCEKACLRALASPTPSHVDQVLCVLAFLATTIPHDTSLMSADYYTTLRNLDQGAHVNLVQAIAAPLASASPAAYQGFAIKSLTSPFELANLDALAPALDPHLLTQAVSYASSDTSLDSRSRLWLLGQYIYLIKGILSVSDNLPTIARLLSSLAEDIAPEEPALDMANQTYDTSVLATKPSRVALNTFLKDQLSRLIDQDAIRSLVPRPDPTSNSSVLDDDSESAQLLASYALILLRIFPSRADDIRMWLHWGPPNRSHDENTVPAVTYFWKGARTTSVFAAISRDPRAAVELLKAPKASISSWQPPSSEDHSGRYKTEWRVILVFLELFTFVLKIMDDEEFLQASSTINSSNALPVSDLQDLTVFLKNLGFSMYFNFQEISESFQPSLESLSPVNLSRYFGGRTNPAEPLPEPTPQSMCVAGTVGMTLDYVKSLVTGLLRSIYERDSRRNFLPKGHWLMTSRFEMSTFITAVVSEDQRRQELQKQASGDSDTEDNDFDHDYDMSSDAAPVPRSQQRYHRNNRHASRRRYLQSVAPRLEILQNMPFMIPFETRVEIFREFVRLDQMKRRDGLIESDLWRHGMMMRNGTMAGSDLLRLHHASIRRKNEFEDAFSHFYNIGDKLKEPIQITFLDEFGLQEAGIDGGGVTKEFLTSVTSEAFDPSYGLFAENSQHLLYPNPTSIKARREALRQQGFPDNTEEHRKAITDLRSRYEFLGRIVGKCLYEGILIDIGFAGFFLLKWALFGGLDAAPRESGYRASFNDLRDLDEELYQGLLKLKHTSDDVQDWGMYFAVNNTISLPDGTYKTVEQELIPNGSERLVTRENRINYIYSVARYRLSGQAAEQTTAFLRGLSSIIQTSWLNMFNQNELQTLIGGAASSISISDLRRNTEYGGVYVIGNDGLEHPSVQLFWKVMEDLPDQERRKVLKFVTSTPRAPLLGFRSLNPRFSIRDSGADEARFPTTSTCVNLLKLPRYTSATTLREKLLYAVNSGAGFDLS